MCTKGECEEKVKCLLQIENSANAYLKRLILDSNTTIKVTCRECDSDGVEGKSRGFLKSSPLEIVLCTNRLKVYDIQETLTHEAVHAYDYTNNRVNFDTCEGLAYSEVRAAREGECSGLLRYPFEWMKRECVKRHAKSSTANLYPGKGAEHCVATVFQEAMDDLQPVKATK